MRKGCGVAQTRRVIRILDAYIHYHADGLTITVGNTESQRETLVATGEHPFYVMGRGFTRGDELTVGQQVATHTQQPVEVLDVDLSPLELVAYNYTVEDYETYFVGEFGLWV
uniref:polymorphic toxin-type HINT domain-containing protein n=1 Tax=Saccharospirillum impatiens TaxID=169438 RepID=UPI001FDF1653